MTSNGGTFKIRVVNLEKLWNFVLYNLYFKWYCQWKTKFESLKFEIRILSMALNGETPKMKVEDLRKLWNFVVYNFLILMSFRV
jgi:hypothetical protein